MDENVSKALVMAGEMLIGLIILSIFAYTFQRIYTFAQNYQDTKERQRIIAFNTQFTKYQTRTGDDPTYIYAEDVVTLTEQVIDWNKQATDDSEIIQLNILDRAGGIIYSTQKASSEFERTNFLVTYKLKGDDTQGNKEYKFSCSAEMDTSSGRVKRLTMQIQGVKD